MSPPSSTAGESCAAVVIGIGATVPDYVETNDDLVERMDTCDVWIRQRTGIGQRHLVKSGEATSDLAVKAGQLALESAGVAQVDAVIVATSTPDRICPSTAPTWPRDWGLNGTAAFDVRGVCTGFLYGLAAAGLIAGGIATAC